MPEFERPVPVHEPRADSWGDVVESAGRRRWPRRRLVGGVALIAALGLLASADVGRAPANEVPRPVRSPIPAPPIVTGPLRLDLPPVTLRLPGTITSFDIDPSGYAAATATDCAVPGCVVSLATSDDLRGWTRRKLPRDATERLAAPDVLVLARGVLLLTEYGAQTPGGWYSADGGRRWHPVTTGRRPALAEVSGRLTLVPHPTSDLPCTARGVAAYHVADGQRVPLRSQPELTPCVAIPYPDPYGRYWVAGLRGGRAAVAYTEDRGRSWTTTVLDGTAGARYADVTFVGAEAYAVVTARDGQPAIYRQTRDGFAQLWRAGPRHQRMHPPVVCPGGLLLAAPLRRDGAGPLVSRDTGRSWSRSERLKPLHPRAVPGFGWSAWYGTKQPRPVYSRDCVRWYGVPVG